MDVIQPFLDHILDIICNHELDLYTYILNWIAFLIQRPGSKTGTALVIIGEQGTGKNKFFTDVISKLFGRNCISNENSIGNIIGRFNSSIENKILIVCNELQSIDNAKHLNTDCLKSLITDHFCTIESKFVNTRSINNISSFIFVSNNRLPIKIESGDHRYLVFKCSDDAKGNFDYFAKLNWLFDDEFYQQLFSYFKNEIEVANFNPRLMSESDINNEIMDVCKESWLLFFE
jgi:hypothetical protein